MKWLRRLLLAVLVVGAVIAAAAVLLPRLVDPGTLRTMLVLAARHHTGRELTVDGDIRFALLPRPAVTLPRLSLADGASFGPEPFASIDSARINLRLWPLLRGRLAVASAEIDHPQLRLTVNAGGRRNWGDLLPSTDPAATPVAPPALPGSVLQRIGIARLAVHDADILWTDRRSGQWARLYRLDASLEDIDFARPSPLRVNGTLDTGDPLRSAQFKLATTVRAADDGHWRAPDLRLDATLTGAPLQTPLPLRLSGDADFDAAHGRLRLRPLTLSNDQFDITGELTAVRGVGNTPAIGAELHIDRLDARTLAQRLGHPPATEDRTALSRVSGTVELGASASELNLARLDLQVDDSHWQGNARFSALASPAVRVAVDADKLDLDRYLPPATTATGGDRAALPTPTGSPAAVFNRLGQLDLQSTINVTALTLGGVVAERVALALRARDGRIAMSPITAGLYGGTAEADVQIDARSADPRLELEFGLDGVAAGPLLGALSRHETVDGRLKMSGNLSGSVAGGEALLRSLNGRLRVAMGAGALRGINPDRSLCRERAAGDRAADGCDPSPDARVSMLRLGGYVAHGVWRSGDVLLVQQRRQPGSIYRLFGGGTLDLATGEIDYRLRARETAGSLHLHGRDGDYAADVEDRSTPRAGMRRSRQGGAYKYRR
jgi:AsmA protein